MRALLVGRDLGRLGTTLALRDVDGDGADDLLLGAPLASTGVFGLRPTRAPRDAGAPFGFLVMLGVAVTPPSW